MLRPWFFVVFQTVALVPWDGLGAQPRQSLSSSSMVAAVIPGATSSGRIFSLVNRPANLVVLPKLPTDTTDTVHTGVRSARLATITTDTGDFAPGHRDFSRYTDPLWCLVAAEHEADVFDGTLAAQARRDSLRLTPTLDSVPTVAVAIARACGARFTMVGTNEDHLADLFNLAMLAMNDSLAHTVVARKLAEAPTDSARWSVLLAVLQVYLHVRPTRLAAAESLVAQVDAMGPSALLLRLQAHAELLSFLFDTYGHGTIAKAQADTVLALARRLSMGSKETNDKLFHVMKQGSVDLLSIAFVDWPKSIPLIAQQIQRDFHQPVQPESYAASYQFFDKQGTETGDTLLTVKVWEFDKLVRALARGYQVKPSAATIRPAELTPDLVFPTADHATQLQGKKRIQIVISDATNPWCDLNDDRCPTDFLGTLRRWMTEYGSAGLSVTVVATVRGHVPQSDLPSTRQLAQDTANYYQVHEHLPVTVVVDTEPVWQMFSIPDQRVFFRLSRAEIAWSGYRDSSYHNYDTEPYFQNWFIELRDQTTHQVIYNSSGRMDWALFEALLARTMADSTTGVVSMPFSSSGTTPAMPASQSMTRP